MKLMRTLQSATTSPTRGNKKKKANKSPKIANESQKQSIKRTFSISTENVGETLNYAVEIKAGKRTKDDQRAQKMIRCSSKMQKCKFMADSVVN